MRRFQGEVRERLRRRMRHSSPSTRVDTGGPSHQYSLPLLQPSHSGAPVIQSPPPQARALPPTVQPRRRLNRRLIAGKSHLRRGGKSAPMRLCQRLTQSRPAAFPFARHPSSAETRWRCFNFRPRLALRQFSGGSAAEVMEPDTCRCWLLSPL